MTLRQSAKELLKKYGLKPQKRFGQNFLVDKGSVAKIITAADLKKDDTVLEIGPGLGFLTRELVSKAKQVIAVEKDKKMAEILQQELASFDNVKIIQNDILKIKSLPSKEYKVVANLPFYITAPAIRYFLEKTAGPLTMTLMVQKEVAQRICAKPPNVSILAVAVQFYAKPKIISYVSKKSFWPSPKVDSAIIQIIPHSCARLGLAQTEEFFKIVKAGFSQPRKQLSGNLSKKLGIKKEVIESWLTKNSIQPSQRAENLSVNDWINLTKSLK